MRNPQFIKEKGTDRFVKFKPDNPLKPFGKGEYVLLSGMQWACVWNDPEHAQRFIDAAENELEMIPVTTTVTSDKQ